MSRNPRIFYTSDTHIGHRLVARERGFVDKTQTEEFRGVVVHAADTQAHDDYLADMWDSTVHPQDIVFVLGDISINGSANAVEWHRQRTGTIHLVSGNHDPVHPAHRGAERVQKKWLEAFDSINPFLRRKLLGQSVLLSHFPYMGTGAEGHGVEDRYTQYRLPDEGLHLLHGHTHGQERHHWSDNGTPELHVGLDAWDLKLVPQETVLEWMENPESFA
jgi:calcineurin-like phosphoesterase family protein